MFANSRRVESAQNSVHPRLAEVVQRHLATTYRRVPSAAGIAAFASVRERLSEKTFVLDSGCGNGLSTLALARDFPDRWVIGVDKSAARLALGMRELQASAAPQNAILLRCELVDFWQLASAANLRCERQFFLYPNPWPKPEHLKRRWHAHPVWPAILALGGVTELRTNWRIYAEEFVMALRMAGRDAQVAAFMPVVPSTPFEHKYLESGHPLWRTTAHLLAS